MQLTCPCCHARNSIEAYSQDEACRELFRHCGQLPDGFWRTLTAYLGLFRSESRALAWDRALKLTESLMQIEVSPADLATAMQITHEALRFKQGKPLKDHNYLKRVLETVTTAAPAVNDLRAVDRPIAQRSKSAAAVEALGQWAAGDWLREEIAAGLQALVAQNLKKAPAADVIALNADIWFQVLKGKCTVQQVDAPRIRRGFELLFPKVEEWPAPKQLLEAMPARPPQAKLPEPEPTAEQYAAGANALREIRESVS